MGWAQAKFPLLQSFANSAKLLGAPAKRQLWRAATCGRFDRALRRLRGFFHRSSAATMRRRQVLRTAFFFLLMLSVAGLAGWLCARAASRRLVPPPDLRLLTLMNKVFQVA